MKSILFFSFLVPKLMKTFPTYLYVIMFITDLQDDKQHHCLQQGKAKPADNKGNNHPFLPVGSPSRTVVTTQITECKKLKDVN